MTDRTELQHLRTALRRRLADHPPASQEEFDDVAERMTIVATELASNALRHADCPALVTLSRTKRALVLDVADDQPLSPPRIAGERAGEGGRGLRIVQDLADDTGWYVAHGRKHVWAQLPAPRRSCLPQAPGIVVAGLDRLLKLLRRTGI